MLWRMLFKGLRAIHGYFVAVSPIFGAIQRSFVAVSLGKSGVKHSNKQHSKKVLD